MREAEGQVDWAEIRRVGERNIMAIGTDVILAGEPLNADTWGMSPEALERRRAETMDSP